MSVFNVICKGVAPLRIEAVGIRVEGSVVTLFGEDMKALAFFPVDSLLACYAEDAGVEIEPNNRNSTTGSTPSPSDIRSSFQTPR